MVRVVGFDPSLTSFGVSDGERHIRIRTTPESGNTFDRVSFIVEKLQEFVNAIAATFVFVIEGPSFGSAMAGALWDAGYIMARFDLFSRMYGATVYVVPPGTLKKFVTGNGGIKKKAMPLEVFKRWGLEFADDPGDDKLHAYCLYRFGEAMLAGKVQFTASKPRGKGKDSTASRRAGVRTKVGLS